MENAYYVTVEGLTTDEIVHSIGPIQTAHKAEKVYDGLVKRIDLDHFYADWAWYGPAPEPTS